MQCCVEITEKERLMLVEKKDEIKKITLELYDIISDKSMSLKGKETKIKKDLTSIISILSVIGSYAKIKGDEIRRFELMAISISQSMELMGGVAELEIEIFCNEVNGITFDFSNRRNLKINIHKIDISLFRKG
jgi:hypothetical protein